MNLNAILLPSVFLALFGLAALVIFRWERRKRGTRAPFASDLRLLRTAGELRLREIGQLDDEFMLLVLGAAVGPGILALVLVEGVARLRGGWQIAGLAATAAALLAVLILAMRFFRSRLRRRADCHLEYYGARVVAEYLDPLKEAGWRLFHDVPCDSGPETFALDHVAVGPGGIFAIRTATRRKTGARAGREDYKVFFDGERLSWPSGEERKTVEEAQRGSKWLQQWLVKTTGENPPVVPVITLPGWYVEAEVRATVRVVDPSWLPDLLAGEKVAVLNERQVDLCARQLEQRVRDVEY